VYSGLINELLAVTSTGSMEDVPTLRRMYNKKEGAKNGFGYVWLLCVDSFILPSLMGLCGPVTNDINQSSGPRSLILTSEYHYFLLNQRRV
jgi:hypothetical protein